MALALFSGMTTASEIACMLFLLSLSKQDFSQGGGEVQPIQQLGASYPRYKLVQMRMNDFQFPNTLALVTSCEVTICDYVDRMFPCPTMWGSADGVRGFPQGNVRFTSPTNRANGHGAGAPSGVRDPERPLSAFFRGFQMARHMQQS